MYHMNIYTFLDFEKDIAMSLDPSGTRRKKEYYECDLNYH